MRRPIAKGLALAWLLAMPAWAQDGSEVAANRTPAKAQAFLAAYPPQQLQAQKGGALSLYLKDGEVSSGDVCETRYIGQPARVLNGAVIKDAIGHREQRLGLGFVHRPASAEEQSRYRLPAGTGLSTMRVGKESDAERLGVVTGMVVAAVEGEPVTTETLAATLARKKSGKLMLLFKTSEGDRNLKLPIVEEYILTGTALPPEPIAINWSRVQQIGPSDSNGLNGILLQTPADPVRSATWLLYSTAQTRDRVLAAAQYLQQACDRTKELGF